MTAELRVVHIDDSLAVVDKPAGLVVHPAPSHRGPTLVDQLGEILGGGEPERPGIVHRLDKGTSGLMVVARDEASLRALQAQVRRREVERAYLALAGGRLPSRSGTIDAPIGRAARRRHRMAVSGAAGPNPFHRARAASSRDARRGAPGDRPHPPDPRPLRRDRPPAGRRPDIRRRAPPWARAALSPRPQAGLHAPCDGRCDGVLLGAPRGPGGGSGGGPGSLSPLPPLQSFTLQPTPAVSPRILIGSGRIPGQSGGVAPNQGDN